MNFALFLETSQEFSSLIQLLVSENPGLELVADDNLNRIFIHSIKLDPNKQGQGTGTKVIRAIQQYAQQHNLPIVLSPHPESRKKAKLLNFYRELGFYPNKGRRKDYSLSSFFGPTWIWRPE